MGAKATTSLDLTSSWVRIASNKKMLVVQSAPLLAEVYIGQAAPAESASGFRIPQKEPHMFPALNDFGGNAWARGSGVLWYATD